MKIFRAIQSVAALFFFFLPLASPAFDKAQICNSEEPMKELLSAYSAESVLNEFNQFYEFSSQHPLENKDRIESGLKEVKDEYDRDLANKGRLNEILRSLNQEAAIKLRASIGAYAEELQNGRLNIQFDLTERLDLNQEQKNALRAQRSISLRESLMSKHEPLLLESLENSNISRRGRAYVVEWVFKIVPDDIQYQGGETEEAQALHRHVWDLVHESGVLRATSRLANGFYWLQTILNHEKPGLSLVLALRDPGDLYKSLNMSLHYSPFLNEPADHTEHAQICDFSESLRSCEMLSFKDWCADETKSFWQKFWGL